MPRQHTFRGYPGGPEAMVSNGPVIVARMMPDVFVQERLLEAGQSAEYEDVHMLVDTGASMSVLDSRIVHRLRMRPVRKETLTVANGATERCMVHVARIRLPLENEDGHGLVEYEIDVVSMPPGEAIMQQHGLIGRDFLRRFNLLYDGPRGVFALTTYVGDE